VQYQNSEKNIINLQYFHAKGGHFKTELLEINNTSSLQLESAEWMKIGQYTEV
jgi:hypothetical protein